MSRTLNTKLYISTRNHMRNLMVKPDCCILSVVYAFCNGICMDAGHGREYNRSVLENVSGRRCFHKAIGDIYIISQLGNQSTFHSSRASETLLLHLEITVKIGAIVQSLHGFNFIKRSHQYIINTHASE